MTKIILPTYVTTIPSTGKTVEFRPYTVKEEKALLLALQEDRPDVVTTAIKNVVKTCTFDKLDPEVNPYYDIEYVFLQIRSKSVGEVIDLVGTCDCDPKAKTNFSVDIDSTFIDPKPTGNARIKIQDTKYTIEFKHPTIDDFVKVYLEDAANAIEVVANCIVNVYSDDEVFSWSYEDKLEFVETMTSKQQREIAEFLRNMPLVKLPASYKCTACGKEHTNFLSGFSNFFV